MDKIIQEFGFGIIPKRVMKDPDLNLQAKGIYAYLCSYAGNKETAFPGVSLITHELGISRNTFYKYLKELKKVGYVEVYKERSENGTFEKNIYKLLPCPKKPYMVKPDTVNPDMEKPYTANEDTNINSININSINNNSINKDTLQQSCKDDEQTNFKLKFQEDSIEIQLARFMIDEMLRIKPDSRVPSKDLKSLQRWAEAIDYMIRLDEREPREIAELFRWAQEDNFWCANIRSPKKLREKWDTLELQKDKRSKPKKSNNLSKLEEMYREAKAKEERLI